MGFFRTLLSVAGHSVAGFFGGFGTFILHNINIAFAGTTFGIILRGVELLAGFTIGKLFYDKITAEGDENHGVSAIASHAAIGIGVPFALSLWISPNLSKSFIDSIAPHLMKTALLTGIIGSISHGYFFELGSFAPRKPESRPRFASELIGKGQALISKLWGTLENKESPVRPDKPLSMRFVEDQKQVTFYPGKDGILTMLPPIEPVQTFREDTMGRRLRPRN